MHESVGEVAKAGSRRTTSSGPADLVSSGWPEARASLKQNTQKAPRCRAGKERAQPAKIAASAAGASWRPAARLPIREDGPQVDLPGLCVLPWLNLALIVDRPRKGYPAKRRCGAKSCTPLVRPRQGPVC